MRAANLLAFDEYLTSGAAVMYTSDALNAQLGAFDQLALMAVVDDVTPDPNLGSSGFKVQIRHSADGRNWLPKNAFGVAVMTAGSRYRSTVIWSSPPIVARTALISGSAKAAIRSAARSCGAAASRRVVGYSTGTTPRSSRSRRMARSCTTGNTAGAANDGDTTATLSPACTLGGTTRSGRMPAIQGQASSSAHPFFRPGTRRQWFRAATERLETAV